jgi:predicted metalloendopeptidase
MTLADAGIVPAWLDRRADPCTDFHAFACGGFLRTAQIPPDRASWGAIELVAKENEELLRRVLEESAAREGDRLGAFYAACMDEDAIERAGSAPIRPQLDLIAGVRDGKTAAAAVIALHAAGVFPLFAIGPQQDYADATRVIASIDQAGLGLPERKYYLESQGSLEKTRRIYVAHMERMFALAGRTARDARAAAANAMAIETALARVQQSEVDRRDPRKVYHRVDRAGLEQKLAPSFPWGEYLARLGIPGVTAISVNDPAYYTAVARLLQTSPPAPLRDYLAWTVLRSRAGQLGRAWVAEAHTMARELDGVKELPPRWRRCVDRTDGDLGELLGQAYVAAKFGGDAKARAVELTDAVADAMGAELDALPWMDAPTRAAARQKLERMAHLVGFPDRWRAYDFPVKRGDFAGNVRAAEAWEQARQLAKIGRPVDRFDWQMSPPTVNAYYDATLNEIALPAGQLQPPFFGARFHPAVNFGATGGGTIGHEITHGFDDEGSQFDGDGNLRDWWTQATKDRFTAATKCIVEQYGRYEAVPGVRLDGQLTAGENIADNGGVKLGLAAYRRWRAKQPAPPPRAVEGFTDEQLYFLAYGQSWCEQLTPELLETMAHSNPHSPARWRVNGVIVNQPDFAAAFACKPAAPMNPAEKCGVW